MSAEKGQGDGSASSSKSIFASIITYEQHLKSYAQS